MAELDPPADMQAGAAAPGDDDCTTIDVARRLNLAVRSVQLMVDRGELQAWKTPGGHRRISRASVDRWLASRRVSPTAVGRAGGSPGTPPAQPPGGPRRRRQRVLLIEDSRHFQNLVSMLLARHFPDVELHIADNGIPGLAMAGQLQPDLLIVDILLPGIDGASLITNLRSHPQFSTMRLLVITSLGEEERAPYAFALGGVPVVHKPQLVTELPRLVAQCLDRRPEASSAA